MWKSFLKLLNVTVSIYSGYHPQSNGQTEQKVQEICNYLRTFCHRHQNTWSQFIAWVRYAQISLHQQSTGLTTFQCIPGFKAPLFSWSWEPSKVPSVHYWFQESERVWDSTLHHVQGVIQYQNGHAGVQRTSTPSYQPRLKVWHSTKDIQLCLPRRKLSPQFIGPFMIESQNKPVTFKVKVTPNSSSLPCFPPETFPLTCFLHKSWY